MWVVFLLLYFFGARAGAGTAEPGLTPTCARALTASRGGAPDVLFLNLDRSTDRRRFMEAQLRFYSLQEKARRVPAFVPDELLVPPEIKTPDECKVFKGKVVLDAESPARVFIDGHCGRPKNSKRELSVTTSHLRALFLATRPSASNASSSPFALILEDDMQLAFDVDWPALHKTVPEDAVMLQLVTSNERDVQALFAKYKKSGGAHLWHKRLDRNDFWCAGAYLVHKERMRPIIDRIVRLLPASAPFTAASAAAALQAPPTPSSPLDAKLVMTVLAGYSRPCFPKLCCNELAAPQEHGHGYENLGKFIVGGGGGGGGELGPTHQACIFAARGYQADHYIFSLARRYTYMLTVPLVGGASVGNVSTLHQEHVSMHVGAFSRIDSIQTELHRGSANLPPWASSACSRFATA